MSIAFVPPAFTKDAVIEAIDAEIPLLVIITEGIPVGDSAEFWAYAQKKGNTTRIIGPNCPGIITPGEALVGITPANITGKGPIGLVSKSGTLTYQMMYELRDIGFSTAIGIGGDPIIGTTHIDALAAFEADPETKAIVMIGEIGGDAEERAAEFIKANVTKPVVGYVAGFTAPEGKTMGHAGAIVSGWRRNRAGQEGGPRGRRRQGRQDAERDRAAHARGHRRPVDRRPSTLRRAAGTCRPVVVFRPGCRRHRPARRRSRMNRMTVALLAALEALIVVAIGIGISLVPLTLLWAVEYGLRDRLVAFWRGIRRHLAARQRRRHPCRARHRGGRREPVWPRPPNRSS